MRVRAPVGHGVVQRRRESLGSLDHHRWGADPAPDRGHSRLPEDWQAHPGRGQVAVEHPTDLCCASLGEQAASVGGEALGLEVGDPEVVGGEGHADVCVTTPAVGDPGV